MVVVLVLSHFAFVGYANKDEIRHKNVCEDMRFSLVNSYVLFNCSVEMFLYIVMMTENFVI
jgi:hypothetical protein